MSRRTSPATRQVQRDAAASAEHLADVADPDEPAGDDRKRGRQAMLRAVNRDLRAMPAGMADSALAELARQLARRFDQGDDKATAQLRGVLGDLHRLSRAAAAPPGPPAPPAEGSAGAETGAEPAEGGASGANPLAKISQNRAVRRSQMARRGADRAPGAPDMDGSE